MKDSKKVKQFFLTWTPFAVCFILGVLSLALHHIVCDSVNKVVYIQVPVGMLVPLIFPAVEKWLKIKIPYIFVILVALQIILSIDMGSAFDFYSLVPHYDKFLHTYFGLWCAAFVYYLTSLFCNGTKEWFKAVLVFLVVLGVAGAWEIFEFTMSLIISDYDPQLWQAAVENGTNPMWDTMMDMIVAVIGAAIFYAILGIDALCGGRLRVSLLGSPGKQASDLQSAQ